jgi:DNA-binding NarL/FixJ family response regulator
VVREVRVALSLDRLVRRRDRLLALRAALPGRLRELQAEIMRRALGTRVDLQATPREREVLEMLAREMSNKEIAGQLNITERTVKFHVSRLLAKYGRRNRRELVL